MRTAVQTFLRTIGFWIRKEAREGKITTHETVLVSLTFLSLQVLGKYACGNVCQLRSNGKPQEEKWVTNENMKMEWKR